MNSKFKKNIISILNFIYALSILSLCVSALMIIVYGLTKGFSNLKVDFNKLIIVVGIPILLLILTKFINKKITQRLED